QYDLFDPKGGEKTGSLKARLVFDKIVNNAWLNGEPGIIFLDRLNKDNVVPSQGDIESTNPCGEQPLLPYESCNLGSVNLVKMMKMTAEGAVLDYDKLKVTIHKAVHFLDNVIEINKYPLPEIDLTTKQTRKIGLGIMGFADILLLLNIAYNSQEAVDYAENLMQFVDMEAKNASADLAKSRGAFPLFAESIYPQDRPLRNATLTTIAPTGTLSIICGCSSGVEPVFAYAYIRNIMDNTEMLEVNPILSRVLQSKGLDNESILRKIADQGSLTGIDELPDDIKRIFVCSHDIDPIYHVKIQAAFQKYTDNAVSKTVNFAKEATQDDVDKVFCLAYQLGCKGVTIYRDGSRDNQVLNIGSVVKGSMENDGKIKPRPRPEVVYGITERMRIGCGNLYVTVNYDDKGICEVFTSTGKVG
ncbi:MAG: adenosylcobalamin-dependent ribonucleoside-diphosphate reductase, partial [Clostridiales bacterium]